MIPAAAGHADQQDQVGRGPLPQSLLPDSATVDSSGHCRIAGVDLLHLARQFGTPLFVYDEAHVRNRCREALTAWGDGVAYASKAFLSKAMASVALQEGMCLDVASGGELAVALAAGAPPDRLVLHGNNKLPDELEAAVRMGVRYVVVDSFEEIDRLELLAKQHRTTVRVLVRVTPGVEAHTHAYTSTGQVDSKFGFGLESGRAAAAVDRIARSPALDLVGIHGHIGSQVFRTDAFERAVQVLAGFFLPLDLPELCIGGGLGVAYVEGETAPTITEWASSVKAAAAAAGIGPHVRLTAEPGRAVVAAAAVTLYTVGVVKQLPHVRTYVAVDGGMSDNPRPVLYGSGYEAFLPRATTADRDMVVRIVGRHCESGDVIVHNAAVPSSLEPGDVLATPVTGAYGYSMASTYNRVPRPAVVFVSPEGEPRVVLRRETAQDLMSLEC
ncbi:MAG: diaminopimelate decarboxylase [Actinomycetota bacterium]|nr:diaminopimelate decarboxylase [Actinomycetota bacterium]